MKVFYIIAVSILLIQTQSLGQSEVTLKQVHQEVLENSFAVRSAKNQKDIAQAEYSFYKSQLKPTLTFGADLPNFSKSSAAVIQPDGSITFTPIRQSNSVLSLSANQVLPLTGGSLFLNSELQRFDDYSSEFKAYNGSPIRLGINQPIFGFNPWKYQKKIQPLLLEESKRSFNVSLEEALGRATQFYFNILIANQNLDIARTNETVNQKLLTITEERLLLGKVSLDEKLQLEIELNNARLSVSQATYQLQDAIATLYTYLGYSKIPENTTFILPDNNETIDIDIMELLSSYRSNRPEIIAFQRSITQADQNLDRAKSDYGFQANLQASVGLARGSDIVSDIYRDPFDEQQFNVSVQVPLLDWGKRKSALAQIKLRKNDLAQSFKQEILTLENEINQQGLFFLSLQNELIILKEIMDKAEERFSISNERYVLGNIDITNLTIAQREKDQTKRNYINALQAYWTTYYQIRALTGHDIFINLPIQYN